ncbi:uncharacterized protein [Spinacia oleracea]|uniref:RNase NYN domain-containing protein n=1 Tax=Spinacia oleracea TaxID=3562 RepID=A0ABM3QGI0_SPIOL|nr:uncharacterized protein LOC130459251 [Spinacia oleracea]XP_056682472.1 uncharacterized protein LOC130459251 [Spinacia oleracea]XP_056682473.1 uncharacterized protein LOC130459251 [Spinacia oleracea]XP_056682474.1 uncharacterized protein LOC130459251 [Spinacia oleracea]
MGKKMHRKRTVEKDINSAEKMKMHKILTGYHVDLTSLIRKGLNDTRWMMKTKLTEKSMREFQFLLYASDNHVLLGFTVALGWLIWVQILKSKRKFLKKKRSHKLKQRQQWSFKKKKRQGKLRKLKRFKIEKKKGNAVINVVKTTVILRFQMRLKLRIKMALARTVPTQKARPETSRTRSSGEDCCYKVSNQVEVEDRVNNKDRGGPGRAGPRPDPPQKARHETARTRSRGDDYCDKVSNQVEVEGRVNNKDRGGPDRVGPMPDPPRKAWTETARTRSRGEDYCDKVSNQDRVNNKDGCGSGRAGPTRKENGLGSLMDRLAMAMEYLSCRSVWITCNLDFWGICFVHKVIGFWGSIAFKEYVMIDDSLISFAKKFGLYVVSIENFERMERCYGCSPSSFRM